MPAEFTQGFFVREAAWHRMGVVLDDYPGREEAMRLAGHDFDVVPVSGLRVPISNQLLASVNQPTNPAGNGFLRSLDGYNAFLRSDNLHVLHVARDSYHEIPNSVPYDFAELLFDEGFKYETGISLKDGALCALTLMLNEPITITGDDSEILPYGCLSWAHDGSGSFRVRTGTIRQVCANTVAASEAEGKRLGTDISIRHTKNWRARVEDARKVVKGAREDINEFRRVMEELAVLPVTPEQRDLFVSTIIGDVELKDGKPVAAPVSERPDSSSRVKTNISTERAKVNALFFGPTIPEAHRLTGYGLFQAGGEYFDHLRNFRSDESYVKRTLLTTNPAKASLSNTIRALVAA